MKCHSRKEAKVGWRIPAVCESRRIIVPALLLAAVPGPTFAEVFNIVSGDTAALISAINSANANGEADVINLEAGIYTLSSVDNIDVDSGRNGLPLIETDISILGASRNASGELTTTIERSNAEGIESFRVLHVKGVDAHLRLDRVRIKGGSTGFYNGGKEIFVNGGGILNELGTMELLDCSVSNNYSGSRGGGVANNGGQATIRNCIISANTGQEMGGGIENTYGFLDGEEIYGTMLIERSAIVHNENDPDVEGLPGGGIHNYRGSLTIRNTTISHNISHGGGGGGLGGHWDSETNLDFVTITANYSGASGGGINQLDNGNLNISRSIVAGNTAGGSGPDCVGNLTSFGYNLIGSDQDCLFAATAGDRVGSAGSEIDPVLTALASRDGWNGAPPTHAPDIVMQLTPNGVGIKVSPAINAIPLADCADDVAKMDQRAWSRGGGKCDIGAHERLAKPLCQGLTATLVGTRHPDVLVGTAGPDVIAGLGGNDSIQGLQGDDVICGGPGNDILEGDGGNDSVKGNDGSDTLNGGGANDLLIGGVGDDVLNGNSGTDKLRGNAGDDDLTGGGGDADECNGGPHTAGDTAHASCEIVVNVP